MWGFYRLGRFIKRDYFVLTSAILTALFLSTLFDYLVNSYNSSIVLNHEDWVVFNNTTPIYVDVVDNEICPNVIIDRIVRRDIESNYHVQILRLNEFGVWTDTNWDGKRIQNRNPERSILYQANEDPILDFNLGDVWSERLCTNLKGSYKLRVTIKFDDSNLRGYFEPLVVESNIFKVN